MKVDEVFEENMQIVILGRTSLSYTSPLQTGRKFLVDEKNSFTQILDLVNMKFVEVTSQKDPTPHLIILAMDVNPIVLAKAEKSMNGFECKYEFIKWQIGVILKA